MDLHDRANFLYSATALEVAARLGLWAGSPEFWEKNEKISPNRGFPGDPLILMEKIASGGRAGTDSDPAMICFLKV